MTTTIWTHDPDAHLDYTWDWTAWLAEAETITTAEIIAVDGITATDTGHDDTSVTTWVTTTLEPGKHGRITCRITTSAGRVDDRSITLQISDR